MEAFLKWKTVDILKQRIYNITGKVIITFNQFVFLKKSFFSAILHGYDMATLTLYNQSDVSQQIHTVITKNAAQIDSQTELAVFYG